MAATKGETGASVRQAVGVFTVAESVRDAAEALLAAGFTEAQLAMLEGAQVKEDALSELRQRTAANRDSPQAPATAFVRKKDDDAASHAISRGLSFMGLTAALAVVLSVAGFWGASALTLFAIIIVAVVIGVFGMRRVIKESDSERLLKEINKGHFVLFARTPDAPAEQQALEIMQRHSVIDARICAVAR